MSANNIREIQNELRTLGHEDYASLLEPYAEKTRTLRRVAFAGEQLSGKSTIINALLGREVVPAGVLPTNCKILVTPAEMDSVVLPDGTREDLAGAEDLCGRLPALTIEADIPFLSENKIEFMEFPEVLGKKFDGLSELYTCDAVVLVMSAEKFLSIKEQEFIAEYVKFIGPERLMLVVNKLSLVREQEQQRVIDHVKSKSASKIPEEVQLMFSDVEYSGSSWEETARKRLLKMLSANVPLPSLRMKEMIASRLENELRGIREEARKNNDLELSSNDDAMLMNSSLTEFRKRENLAVQVLTDNLRSAFDGLQKSSLDQFTQNGNDWYMSSFSGYVSDAVRKIVDQYANEAFSRLQEDTVKLSIGLEGDVLEAPAVNMPDSVKDIAVIQGGKDWYKYRTFALYGVSGLAVVLSGIISKFSLLSGIMTGWIVLGGGAAGDFVMRTKNQMMASDIERSIKLTADRLSSEVIDTLSAEVRKAYHLVEADFRSRTDSVIGRGIFVPADENSEAAKKMRAFEGVIRMLKAD